MPKRITKAQRLQLDRLNVGGFTGVAAGLKANKTLWDSFVFGRSGRYGVGELIELRDLPDGILNADELLIVTDKSRWPDLKPIVESWEPQEIGYTAGDNSRWGTSAYMTGQEVGEAMGCSPLPADLLLVRVWWD